MTRPREGRDMGDGGCVQVAVLGPIEVADDNGAVVLAPQSRRLLGVLVAAGGRAVSTDRLADTIADGRSEGSTVRTAVSRLRKVLGDRVESAEGGYRLVLAPDELDAAWFERLATHARSSAGEVQIAALAKALELWRGRPFGDLADEAWAAASVGRWEELRATVIEDLAAALSAEGRHREAVELLDGLVREQPYRERPVELLMRSLAADGRVADGLRAFERFRVTMRDDLGLDPSPELRAVESELLAASDVEGPAATTLPSGTVTFVFTDIEGSTQRWAADEAAMTAALAAHDGVLREVISSHGGVVFKHTGDGVCAVFTSAPAAVAAAVEAQERLELPVRMGLHTGEAELRDGDYFGPTLNRVARIMDAGHGGQILMSAATAGLVPDVATVDLGRHSLKGLAAPERLVQVGSATFPPLRVATARQGNLPNELSEFVGRTSELAELVDRLAEHRLITLLGVGGTGKTRLALEVARSLSPTFPDGCWLAELALVRVPEALPFAISAGLGITPPQEGDVIEHVVERVRSRRALLIVDNCEHLLDDAAEVVGRLAAECPALTVIATSREPLMIRGEHLFPVPSLSDADAAELFATRARGEAPDVQLDGAQAAAIEQLCGRLDRLPLAIELAASRLRTMTPIDLLDRIDDRFKLLAGGRRSRMERHETMRGTIDWSYELCTEPEQAVFCRLSVFAAPFDLAAAQAVAADLGGVDVGDVVRRLVERSLVQRVTNADGTSRFRLLETMRAYGRERLDDEGSLSSVRDRHADFVGDRVAALGRESFGPREVEVQRATRALTADALQAVDWLLERRDWHGALRVTGTRFGQNARTSGEILRRITAAVSDVHGSLEVLDPVERLHLMFSAGGDEVWTVDRAPILALVRDLIRSDASWGRDDFISTPPHTGLVLLQHDALPFIDEVLESLQRQPPPSLILEFSGLWMTVEWLVEMGEHEAVPAWLDRALDESIARLDSSRARRMRVGQYVLVAEAMHDFERAARLATEAIADVDEVFMGDVLNACRLLRVAGMAGVSVSGADLRRPWEWIDEGGLVMQEWAALHSTARALESLGETAAADRLLARGKSIAPKEFDALVRLVGLYWDAERLERIVPSREKREAIVSVVYSVADALDGRAAAEGRGRPPSLRASRSSGSIGTSPAR